MDPVTIAALIGGGANLVGGLLGQQAQRSEELKKRMFEGQMMGFQAQQNAAQHLSEGQQNAFQNLMAGYGKALT